MDRRKKVLLLYFLLTACFFCLSGCGQKNGKKQISEDLLEKQAYLAQTGIPAQMTDALDEMQIVSLYDRLRENGPLKYGGIIEELKATDSKVSGLCFLKTDQDQVKEVIVELFCIPDHMTAFQSESLNTLKWNKEELRFTGEFLYESGGFADRKFQVFEKGNKADKEKDTQIQWNALLEDQDGQYEVENIYLYAEIHFEPSSSQKYTGTGGYPVSFSYEFRKIESSQTAVKVLLICGMVLIFLICICWQNQMLQEKKMQEKKEEIPS